MLGRTLFEPPEDRPVAFDWRGTEIYECDPVYRIVDQNGNITLVHEDELKEYIENEFGRAEAFWS